MVYITWNTRFSTTATPPPSSNLACFFCSQLLSVTKHRVGLSQNQLRVALYDKCRMLPNVLKDQCFTFVETSLPEIYFSLNYDFSTKDICIRLNLCDEASPFVVPPSQSNLRACMSELLGTQLPAVLTERERDRTEWLTRTPRQLIRILQHSLQSSSVFVNRKTSAKETQSCFQEEKRVTCAFCERMLENAKNYAVTAKADISSFANTACTRLPKGRYSDHCYQLADKKITELAKFVDQQVIEALWCAELNQC
ncbi:unnamed protein product [Heligmosomoides polygyrus]|uniref:Surfactant protein B n=1 Tax=Heligmosomoides polygyrus TaxID=6339 RepID=A0A183FF99_HELPZ|nr:unnamed protein product [Heligmosomoides polygyrus]